MKLFAVLLLFLSMALYFPLQLPSSSLTVIKYICSILASFQMEDRRDAVVSSLVKYLGPEAASYIHYEEKVSDMNFWVTSRYSHDCFFFSRPYRLVPCSLARSVLINFALKKKSLSETGWPLKRLALTQELNLVCLDGRGGEEGEREGGGGVCLVAKAQTTYCHFWQGVKKWVSELQVSI